MDSTRKHDNDLVLLKKLQSIKWWFVALIFLLATIGFVMLYSVARGEVNQWAFPQIKRFVFGAVLMMVIILIDIKVWFRLAPFIYLFGIALLLLVEFTGFVGMGAQRWIRVGGFTLQPSEFMKVFMILMLARYYHKLHYNNLRSVLSAIPALLMILIPAGIILKQPNMGTATIIILCGGAIMFLGGIGWKKFALAGVALVLLMPVVWSNMHDYQKQRVMTFVNPEADPLGAGYNSIQSMIAIGSGGFFGKGYMQGSQSQLDFLPEKQTDFIFTVICEEFGFAGGMAVLIMYMLLLWYCFKISLSASSQFAKLLAGGIGVLLFIHVFVNIGMVTGVLPVVGVALPLLSYGGSSLLSTMVGFGFLLNMDVHKHRKITGV